MLKKLFTPVAIGSIKLANRIVMPAVHLNYTPEGFVTDRLICFYVERAAGGVGLIIVGGCPVPAQGLRGHPRGVQGGDGDLNPILLTAQHLNSEIIKLTQRIEELERELLRAGEEQSESENRHLKQGRVSGDETVHPSPRR